ncbi:MAG TPA: hypothetical protein VKQ05_03775 [Gemmatimonadales bacterium]|nr:hypothetical protein [Gemmatimonadales bacterium]
MRLSVLLLPLSCATVSAQTPSAAPLFQSLDPITLRLDADFHALTRDRGKQKKEHPAVLRYAVGTDTGTINVKLKTRGIFRLKTCSFPPIRVDFPKHKVEGTPFAGQDRLKLVTHCFGDRSTERNLLREYSLYRALNAVTDTSLRVRLAHVTYVDSARHDTTVRYAFFVESDSGIARRVDAVPVLATNVYDPIIQPSQMTLVALFEYLIGNLDWSVWGRHNIVILQKNTDPKPLLAVPYDFDFSGAVNASYASPPPQIPVKSVREHWYRGFCQPDSILEGAVARFRAAKDSIYANVRAVPDLPAGDARSVLDYFDEFFHVIDNRGALNREFVRNCRTLRQ